MAYLDTDKILNGSPKKRLIIGYNELKKDFNESTAQKYSELYMNQPLSFILENSRMIFAEPFYGYEFYSDIITGDEELCMFPKYEVELEKINRYIDENRDNMDPAQLKMYTDLRDKLVNKMNECKNTTIIAQRVDDKTPEIEDKVSNKISNALFDYKMGLKENNNNKCKEAKEELDTVFRNSDKETNLTYAPFVNKAIPNSSASGIAISKIEGNATNDPATRINESVIVSKLFADKAYQEAVSNIPKAMDRIVFTELANENIIEQLDEIITERVNSVETYYASPNSAVNNIFDDEIDEELFREDNNNYKRERYGIRLEVLEYVRDIITSEYQICDDINAPITGFSFFNENTSIEDAFRIINEMCNDTAEFAGIVTEKPVGDDEDVTDDDIDSMDKEINDDDGDESKKSNASEHESEKNNVNDKSDDTSSSPIRSLSGKSEAPETKNLANKVQFKAMDAEVKQNKARAVAKQKGQEVKNAAKAVTQLPKNVMNDVKDQIAKIDKADDDRRMKYMSEPGFRKKALRNLRLATLYGGAARVNLALIPVIQICRHFSKKKDARIRNQLVRDIDTEIKITDEKINDASSNGDNAEKYKLMRIKSALEAERVRVRMNSKYV